MKAAARLKRNAEIDRQLDAGIPVKRIALDVGLSERQVFNRKTVWLRSKRGEVPGGQRWPWPTTGNPGRIGGGRGRRCGRVKRLGQQSLGLPPIDDLDLDELVSVYLQP